MVLEILRNEMEKEKIDAYIIPTLDPHGSEYLPDYYKEREFVTGFTGSAGIAVVTQDQALLWTDGRYFIQASKEIENTGFKLMKMGIEGYPTYIQWLKDNLEFKSKLGLNSKYFLQSKYEDLKENLSIKEIEINDIDLIKNIWKDRPSLSDSKIYIHEKKYTGLSSQEKIKKIRKELKEREADLTILNSLDDIAWIFNIRADDIKHTPVVISYAIIEQNNTYLFIDKSKLSEKVESYLKEFSTVKNYDEIFNFVNKSYENKNIYINKNKMNNKLFSSIKENNKIISGRDLSTDLKAIKNEVELKNQKNAYIKDGVALTKFIYWLKNKAKLNKLREYEVSLKLREFRNEQKDFLDDSFESIVAYGPNAAMMHYKASKENSSIVKNKGFLLVDSGGQYLDGTTDITRTIALGVLTDDEIKDFTYVLKSHLMLSTCVFLKGTTDTSLDAIARYNIWKTNYDYKSGTGHGVGYLLGVHENPPSISPKGRAEEIKDGMIFSNEPGIYKENKYGIRLENIMEVINDQENESGHFYKFNIISYAPIDIDAINVKYLEDYEIEAINNYHEEVFKKLSPFLNPDEKAWLKKVTNKISK
ncbi:MAG: aminopeptidase P family protein [Peptoniphilaceae bacterium]